MIEILMATYNGARFIGEQLDSILEQDHRDFHLLVRDDGSADDTVAILQAYAARDERVILIEDDRGNLGASRSFFELIRRSESDHIMLSDQDDVWLPDKISRTFARMNELVDQHGGDHPLAVFTGLKVVNERLEVIDESFWHYQRLDPAISRDWRSLLAQNVVTGCTLMFNRPARSVIMPYSLPAMMHDHWIAANVAKHGHIAYLTEPTVMYRQHEKNVEGASNVGFGYLFSKLPKLMTLLSSYSETARVFGDVSAAQLVRKKIALNLKRFSAR